MPRWKELLKENENQGDSSAEKHFYSDSLLWRGPQKYHLLPSIKTSLKFATFRSEIFVAVSRLTSFLFTTFNSGNLTVFKLLFLANSGPRQKLKYPWKCLSLARRKPASKIISLAYFSILSALGTPWCPLSTKGSTTEKLSELKTIFLGTMFYSPELACEPDLIVVVNFLELF